MLIIGSTALKEYFPDIREPKDLDIIIAEDHIEEYIASLGDTVEDIRVDEYCQHIRVKDDENTISLIELFIARENNALWDYLLLEEAYDTTVYASLECLYSLKRSHIHYPAKMSKFLRHIFDYNLIYNKLVIKGEYDFYNYDKYHATTDKYTIETEERKGKVRTPSLNKSSDEFFGQSEGRVLSWFIHDEMHEVMAHYDEPLYNKMKPDNDKVLCSKALWEDFTYQEKCQCILEEAYVIALERKIIPMLYGGKDYWSSTNALKWSLMRISTNLCSGWFREFAATNYMNIITLSNEKYVEKFLEAVDKKQIKQIEE